MDYYYYSYYYYITIVIMIGFRSLKSLTQEEVNSVIRNLRSSYCRSDIDGDTLYNCSSVEDVLELLPMPRPKAKAFFSCINKFRAQGVPLHLLVPTGT